MSRNSSSATLIPTVLSNGVTLSAQLVLTKELSRQQQKLKTLQKYIRKYPSGWKKRLEVAELLYNMGQWEQAIEELYLVIERRPISVEGRLLLGKLLQLTGKVSAAIALYEGTFPFIRDQATKHHITGLIAQCRHCYQNAIYPFERAVMSEPSNIVHWLALGQLYVLLDSPKAALRTFNTLLSLHPDEVTGLIYSYDLLLQLGQDLSAEERLNHASALAPKDFRVLVRLAARRCQQRFVFGKAGHKTQQLIVEVLKSAPHEAQGHHLLASYHHLREEQHQAKTVLHRFTQQYPEQPYGWVYYAHLLFHLDKLEMAAEMSLRAYNLYQGDREIYYTLCNILPAAGQLNALKPILPEMLTAFPESWRIWTTVGQIQVEHFQQFEQGIANSAKAIELQPELAEAWFYHGRVLMLSEQYSRAIETLEYGWQLAEIDRRARSISAASWLAKCYDSLGKAAQCQQWLSLAV